MRAFMAVVALSLGILLSSCASSGKKFNSERVSEIKDGSTTKAQIEEIFGAPYSRTSMSTSANGATLRYTYVYAHSSAGGGTGSKALVIDFKDSGTVVEHAYSEQGKPLK
jgi:outer membrane protein assembly factor BamE (lipoprotein component of BamABCDE complex)